LPIFDVGSPAYQATSVTNSAIKIWSGTVSALASISPAVTVRDLTIVNAGTVTAYVGGSSVAGAATGAPLPSGGQLTIQGWTATTNTTTNDVWAITASGTTQLEAGLATLASVV
jgi:hypothetical protein